MKASPEGKPLPKEECYPMFDNAKLEPEIRDKVYVDIFSTETLQSQFDYW